LNETAGDFLRQLRVCAQNFAAATLDPRALAGSARRVVIQLKIFWQRVQNHLTGGRGRNWCDNMSDHIA